MCMATQPARASATTGHNDAETSLTIVAPACNAASATARLRVSTETLARPSNRRASSLTTGTTRRISSPSGTVDAPGRLDSPPTSTTSAPSSTISQPRAMAASWSAQRPPS